MLGRRLENFRYSILEAQCRGVRVCSAPRTIKNSFDAKFLRNQTLNLPVLAVSWRGFAIRYPLPAQTPSFRRKDWGNADL